MVKQPSRAARSGARTIKRPGSATLPIYTRKRPSSETTKVHVESVCAVTSLHIHCRIVAHVVCVCGETLSFCFCMVYMICHGSQATIECGNRGALRASACCVFWYDCAESADISSRIRVRPALYDCLHHNHCRCTCMTHHTYSLVWHTVALLPLTCVYPHTPSELFVHTYVIAAGGSTHKPIIGDPLGYTPYESKSRPKSTKHGSGQWLSNHCVYQSFIQCVICSCIHASVHHSMTTEACSGSEIDSVSGRNGLARPTTTRR